MLYLISYGEVAYFEEYVEADTPEHARKMFINSLEQGDISPLEVELTDFSCEPVKE